MNICDHLFSEDEIIGIGPLMMQPSSSNEQLLIYGSHCYYFELHFRNHTTTIKSTYFKQHGMSEEEKKISDTNKRMFKESYFTSRKKIAEMIGEPDPVNVWPL